MLCPVCLRDVNRFDESVDERGVPILTCPACSAPNIPLLYQEEYEKHPAIVLSIIGLTHHGKTVYITSLIDELERLGASWDGFFCNWLDETQLRVIRKRLQEIAAGRLPDATRSVFQRPQVVRLSNIPRVGGCQLLIYDTGGETFETVDGIREAGKYVFHSNSIVWLMSLQKDDLQTHQILSDTMTIYTQAMATMKANTRNQNLIIALTKGDLLLQVADLPQSARDFLNNDVLDPRHDPWQRLEKLSSDLENWLKNSGYHNMVNTARNRFKSVRYCIVSAQGSHATDQKLKLQIMPRGVLAPLFWLWRDSRPMIQLQTSSSTQNYLSLDEAIADAPAGATLRIPAGNYVIPKRIEIRQPITIVGEGNDLTTLRVMADKFSVGIKTSGVVTFRNLVIERAGAAAADVIRVMDGELHLDKCTILNAISAPRVAQGSGIILTGKASLSMIDSRIERCEAFGLSMLGQSHAKISRSKFIANHRAGVMWSDGSSGQIVESISQDNKDGLRVQSSGAVIMSLNRCLSNRRNGILIENSPDVDMNDNVCQDNAEQGIEILGESSVQLRDNQCLRNQIHGILIGGPAKAGLENNLIEWNRLVGIKVLDTADIILKKNRVLYNETNGIEIAGSATAECTENECDDNNDHGICLSDRAILKIMGANSCRGNGGYGVWVSEAVQMNKMGRNTLSANKLGDIKDLRKKGWF